MFKFSLFGRDFWIDYASFLEPFMVQPTAEQNAGLIGFLLGLFVIGLLIFMFRRS